MSQILQSLYTVYKQIKLEVDQQQATGQKTHFRLVSAGNTIKGWQNREWNKGHTRILHVICMCILEGFQQRV